MSAAYDPIPLDFTEYPPDQMRERAAWFYEQPVRENVWTKFSRTL